VAEYRAYIVGNDGHFVSLRAFICEGDEATAWAASWLKAMTLNSGAGTVHERSPKPKRMTKAFHFLPSRAD
jgi:hypothetical protein